jgi:hypothetical protein
MIRNHRTDTTREVVATANLGGGTRVIVLTARENGPYHITVTATAYDSNHPGEFLLQAYYAGQYLPDLLRKAREAEVHAFDPRDELAEGCGCWARWDPACGEPGCWGTRVTVAAVA